MAKTKISEYSSTANSNTDIASINIDEGCAPSGINNAIRALMAQLKDFQTGAASDPVTVGGVLTVTGGSASTPAITTSGDTNTGVLFPAADTVGVTTGGTERVRVDSSGNVGIGTSSPSKKFVVSNAGAAGVELDPFTRSATTGASLLAYNRSGSAFVRMDYDAEQHLFLTSASERMRIDSSGNVGIGTSSPAQKLSVNGSILATQGNKVGVARSDGALVSYIANVADNETQWRSDGGGSFSTFYTAGSERARIDSSGNLLVGTTSSSRTSGPGIKMGTPGSTTAGTISVVKENSGASDDSYNLYSTGAGAYRFYVTCAGQIYATSTSIVGISDASLKENVRDLETGLSEVMALQPRRFDWKNGDAKDVAGFIAQEVENVLPELVYEYKYNAEENKKALKMGDILPTLVKAIQEQQAIIQTLTARIEALEQA